MSLTETSYWTLCANAKTVFRGSDHCLIDFTLRKVWETFINLKSSWFTIPHVITDLGCSSRRPVNSFTGFSFDNGGLFNKYLLLQYSGCQQVYSLWQWSMRIISQRNKSNFITLALKSTSVCMRRWVCCRHRLTHINLVCNTTATTHYVWSASTDRTLFFHLQFRGKTIWNFKPVERSKESLFV